MKSTLTLIVLLAGLSVYAQSHSVELGPNPFADSIRYNITANYGDTVQFKLFDLNGKERANVVAGPFYFTKSTSFQIEPLNLGPYITTIQRDTTIEVSKILKKSGNSHLVVDLNVNVIPLDKDELLLRPNPAKETLTLVLKSTTKKASISVSDLNGKKLLMKDFTNETGLIEWSLNVEHLPDGVYIIHAISENGTIAEQLIKKNQTF